MSGAPQGAPLIFVCPLIGLLTDRQNPLLVSCAGIHSGFVTVLTAHGNITESSCRS